MQWEVGRNRQAEELQGATRRGPRGRPLPPELAAALAGTAQFAARSSQNGTPALAMGRGAARKAAGSISYGAMVGTSIVACYTY
jgi:hypothetical protein